MDREGILDRLKRSDMVLVGIGEAFDGTKYLQESQRYGEGCELLKEAELSWMLPGWKEYCLERLQDDKIEAALTGLENLLAGKNSFLVSVSTNRRIVRNLRAVMPCGSTDRKQCPNGCSEMPAEVTGEEQERIREAFRTLWEGRMPKKEPWLGICGECGSAYTFNSVYSDHYNEKGYSDQWELYTKWLQGTLHHNLLILELGVGMKFPTVIRWPFEKTAYLNQKAYLCRVNEHLYYLPPELVQRGCGISEDAVEWIAGGQ